MSAGFPLWPHEASYRMERARQALNLVERESRASDWLASLKPWASGVERQRRSVNASMRWATWRMVEQAQEHGWHLSPEAFRAFVRTDARRLEERRVISSIGRPTLASGYSPTRQADGLHPPVFRFASLRRPRKNLGGLMQIKGLQKAG